MLVSYDQNQVHERRHVCQTLQIVKYKHRLEYRVNHSMNWIRTYSVN